MNTETPSAPPAATRTSGLAIAAFVCGLFSCLCLPALPAFILGIVAVVQMGKDPSLKGKGFAIAGIALPVLTSLLILPAIAIPNFMKFQARAKKSECRTNLKSISVAQRSMMDEGFTEDVSKLGFMPEPNTRYTYFLSSNPQYVEGRTAKEGDNAVRGTHKDAIPDERASAELDRILAGNARVGLSQEGVFTAICVGNLDSDDANDVWSISSADRDGPDGPIPAWELYNEWDDVTDSAGGSGSSSPGSKSRFDD